MPTKKKMPTPPPPQPGDKRYGKSAVTNGTVLFDGTDGRSKQARRLRDLILAFTAELGGADLSPTEEMVIGNAALAKMKTEELSAKMAAGEDVSDEDCVRIGNLSSRATRDLHAAKAKRRPDAGQTIDTIAAWPTSHLVTADEDEDDGGFEPVPGFDDPAPTGAEIDRSQARLASIVEPEPIVEAPKPQCLVEVFYDARPGHASAQTLHQIVGALQARNAVRVTFTTPAVRGERSVDGLVAEVGAVIAAKCAWHVRGLE
jgi:hypothetical protein